MRRIAQFEKVSFEQFSADYESIRGSLPSKELYDDIMLPKRATSGSAGYDFYLPEELILESGESARIPTGIRVRIEDGWMLGIYPRSGLGFKFRMQLDNTVGIIDSDYYGSDNEGHIQIKITNDSREGKTLNLPGGKAFAQGIFTEYGITFDDNADGIRNGGFGSTGNSK